MTAALLALLALPAAPVLLALPLVLAAHLAATLRLALLPVALSGLRLFMLLARLPTRLRLTRLLLLSHFSLHCIHHAADCRIRSAASSVPTSGRER
ncbi:hypothetical protein BKK79_03750 [Cupriavidus sp. USMAA2-4]|uniref:hypothetical protein n=1 Tax=Cupriavidus sp. USMAA2-4 TaxID=876364 RepID=UPI0008A6BDB0|nr:hypothetical protein [Cupriavidus sp. USMAA2-4]AOY91027.1 hypothetical protein BKK79_03750 [Cupriavidus sp. USMAA2-4]